MEWRLLRWSVPVAIVLVGYWLLTPLVAPGLAPSAPPVAEAPVIPTRIPTVMVQPAAPVPAAPISTSTQVAVTGLAAPTAAGPPAMTPVAPAAPAVYRASPVQDLKVEPRSVEVVRLGRIEQGAIVRLSVSVRFNVGISNLSGVPDVDVHVSGPTGTVAEYPGSRDGTRFAFSVPQSGEYELRLDNTRSRINAKRVTVQFG